MKQRIKRRETARKKIKEMKIQKTMKNQKIKMKMKKMKI